MTDQLPLDRLQKWMLAVITDPRGVAAGIASNSAQLQVPLPPGEVERVIDPSRACTSLERLAVYGNAYFARLLECLQGEFDATAKAAGDEAFVDLAAGYLQAHPPSSYTLGQLGARFPQYLAETRPPRTSADAPPDWADFLVDLARLEWTSSQVFDGPGEEGLPQWDPAGLTTIPSDHWGELRVQVTRSLQLLSLQFPVHESLQSLRADEFTSPPAPRPVQLAIFRRRYAVQRRELTPIQATLLSALQQGEAFHGALSTTLAAYEIQASNLETTLQRWFHDWTEQGLICGLAIG